MFENFDYDRLELIYLGLKALIESGTGYCFHNADMGHPVYLLGSKGKIDQSWGDSPEENLLFQMLSELSVELNRRTVDYIWFYDFSDWQKFCQFVIDAYRKRIGYSLTDAEAERLAGACKSDIEKIVIWTLLDTGIRPPKLAKLGKKDIDMERWYFKNLGPFRHGAPISPRLQPIIENYFASHSKLEASCSTIYQIVKRVANRAHINWQVKADDLYNYWAYRF